MQLTIFEAVAYFLVYAFLGWCTEVIFAALKTSKFVNRGFLLGPVCPIYGFGVIAVLYLLAPMFNRPLSVFIMSVLITSAVEFLVGWLAEKLLHTRLWDYSDCFMNVGGYICLAFSLMWGVGCMAVIYIFHPVISRLISLIPKPIGIPVTLFLLALVIADTVITLIHALKIESRMKAINDTAKTLEKLSNKIGTDLYDGTVTLMDKAQESEKLQKHYRRLINNKNIVHEHLFKAFDHLKNKKYKTAYDRIKQYRADKK